MEILKMRNTSLKALAVAAGFAVSTFAIAQGVTTPSGVGQVHSGTPGSADGKVQRGEAPTGMDRSTTPSTTNRSATSKNPSTTMDRQTREERRADRATSQSKDRDNIGRSSASGRTDSPNPAGPNAPERDRTRGDPQRTAP
jgi:hypothetical protein